MINGTTAGTSDAGEIVSSNVADIDWPASINNHEHPNPIIKPEAAMRRRFRVITMTATVRSGSSAGPIMLVSNAAVAPAHAVVTHNTHRIMSPYVRPR